MKVDVRVSCQGKVIEKVVTMTSAWPWRIMEAQSPTLWTPAAQAVDTAWLGPWKPYLTKPTEQLGFRARAETPEPYSSMSRAALRHGQEVVVSLANPCQSAPNADAPCRHVCEHRGYEERADPPQLLISLHIVYYLRSPHAIARYRLAHSMPT